MMRIVQITLNEELLALVDQAAKRLKMTRSAFTRKALREALDRLAVREREERHRLGYEQQPVRKGEFDVWEKEQAWPDP
jgi:metal-responsive CopG/Arc/MetJ family transcriptional regulator